MEETFKKPVQRTTYAEKVANNYKRCRDTMDYYIRLSRFNHDYMNDGDKKRDLISLYQIYNNQFPNKWFNFVTNPLNSTNDAYKNFPARIRKMNILRANIDRVIGEYNKRPFHYGVENRSEDAYNSYLEQKMQALYQNIYQNFINEAAAQGIDVQSQEVPPPEKLLADFDTNYTDALAEKAQKFISLITDDVDLIEKFVQMFKDYCISGTVVSFKEVFDGKLEYDRVSPVEFDHDASPNKIYFSDSEWCIQRQYWTAADVADRFYHELKEKDYKSIESHYNTRDIQSFADSLQGHVGSNRYVEVIRVAWASQKKVGIWSYIDPVTGTLEEEEVDDTFKVPEHLKVTSHLKWEWKNEYWLGYRVNSDLYFDIRPVPFNPFNGRNFSDEHSQNLSLLEMGIPYLILYIILNYRLELTIAKSKGKITLIDQNVIPSNEDWDEEKFIYYSEAMGWGVINRDQIGVDKSFNQYQVLDMSLFQNITQLTEIIEYVKRQWDEVTGMNEYRKGQMAASAGKAQTERGVFQGGIISDLLFFTYENFVKNEYQSLLDLSKYLNTDGIRRVFLNSDMKTQLLEIEAGEFAHADLGIFVTNSSIEQDRIRELKMYAQQSLANGGKLSMIADIVAAESMAEIKRLIKTAERMEIEQAETSADNEASRQQQIEEIRKEFENYKAMLETRRMHEEYDRKEDIEHIKGQYNQLSFTQTLDANNNGIPDANEVAKNQIQIEKDRGNMFTKMADIRSKEKIKEKELRDKEKDRKLKEKEIESRERIEETKAKTALKNKVVGE